MPSANETDYEKKTLRATVATEWATVVGLLISIAGLVVMARNKPVSPPASGGTTPVPARLVDPGDSVLLLGDSIGVGIENPLASLLAQYGAKFSSDVEIGRTIAGVASHLSPLMAYNKVTVLSVGSNDAVLQDPYAEAQALDHLLDLLRSNGGKVYWFLPPSFLYGQLTGAQQKVANLLQSRGVKLLHLAGPQPSVSSDPQHLHPTVAGYKTLASQVFDALTTRNVT